MNATNTGWSKGELKKKFNMFPEGSIRVDYRGFHMVFPGHREVTVVVKSSGSLVAQIVGAIDGVRRMSYGAPDTREKKNKTKRITISFSFTARGGREKTT